MTPSPLTAATLAAFVRACRGELTQSELADKCTGTPGITQAVISRWERNVYETGGPNGTQVRAIVTATGHGEDVLNHGLSLVVGFPVALRPEGDGAAA